MVINEVLTRTIGPDLDGIELYNSKAGPIDVTGWWLSDSSQKFDKFVIPSTIIPAGGYIFFDENDFNASGDPMLDFALDGTGGEQVWLIKPNAAGTSADLLVDGIDFGPGLVGKSLGRWPNSTGRPNPMKSTTLGAANSGPRVGPIVISEIMYNAPSSPGEVESWKLEYVEVYNPTAQNVDLTNWEIDGIEFQFVAGDSIGPGQILVIVPFDPVDDVTAIANFQGAYNVSIGTGPARYLGPYRERLDNDGEEITLFRADNPSPAVLTTFPLVTEDRVFYEDRNPWPTA